MTEPSSRATQRATTAAAKRTADLDQLQQALDRQIARVGERVENTRRTHAKALADYAELIEARTLVQGLRR